MLSGFNTNVRHRGVVFHVQTEDSGRARPHVITLLYHEGTILASQKLEYADRLESPDLESDVKRIMETQHQAMLDRLGAGELDSMVEERLGEEAFPEARAAAAAPETARPDRKPLDELILDYLVESARKRKHRTK